MTVAGIDDDVLRFDADFALQPLPHICQIRVADRADLRDSNSIDGHQGEGRRAAAQDKGFHIEAVVRVRRIERTVELFVGFARDVLASDAGM